MPIPGTTKLHRLEENLGAADVELTAEDLREIDAAASQIAVQGARYPEQPRTPDRAMTVNGRRAQLRCANEDGRSGRTEVRPYD